MSRLLMRELCISRHAAQRTLEIFPEELDWGKFWHTGEEKKKNAVCLTGDVEQDLGVVDGCIVKDDDNSPVRVDLGVECVKCL